MGKHKSFLPKLIATHYITEAQSNEFFAEWNDFKNEPGRFFIAPTMMNIIARKK